MYRRTIFPILTQFDAETAHNIVLSLLHTVPSPVQGAISNASHVVDPRLSVNLFGLNFANPVGLAAGFDKNGLAPDILACLGFGFIEAGTVTPRPQKGNPRPRIFRLTGDEALINRIGMANFGMRSMQLRLTQRRRRDYVLGINVSPNAGNVEPERAIEDYLACIRLLHPYADYLTINVSSPNTKGLRLLQRRESLTAILQAIFSDMKERGISKPLLVKIPAPDLAQDELEDVLDVVLSHPVAGLITTNTLVQRPSSLTSNSKTETGGLSGRPVAAQSSQAIRTIFTRTEGRLPIIGVGGVFTARDAIEKIRAGASLVQLYTGLIYQGPTVVRDINRGLLSYLDAHGIGSISELVGVDAINYAPSPLPPFPAGRGK